MNIQEFLLGVFGSIRGCYRKRVHCSTGLVVGLIATGLQAADSLPPIQVRSNAPQSLERRLATLEKRLSGETLMEILDQLDALKREVRELRGGVEETTHGLDGIKKRQRNLYLDVDQRLQKLEGSASVSQFSDTPQYSAATENISPKPPIPQQASSQEANSYKKAYKTLQDRHYNSAIQQLKTFLDTYPNGQYAGNAQYWLGEAFYSRRDIPQAKAAFSRVVEQHPSASKAADALLKLGFVEYELGNWANSKQWLNELVSRHPNSTAAKLAQKRLQQMRKEKH